MGRRKKKGTKKKKKKKKRERTEEEERHSRNVSTAHIEIPARVRLGSGGIQEWLSIEENIRGKARRGEEEKRTLAERLGKEGRQIYVRTAPK
jgi:hypothetical protein